MPVSSGQIYHYLLDMNTLGQLSIENGRKFENLTGGGSLLQDSQQTPVVPGGGTMSVNMFPPMESEVRHGPLRIDESEIVVRGDLSK